jgi:hypothetical protein
MRFRERAGFNFDDLGLDHGDFLGRDHFDGLHDLDGDFDGLDNFYGGFNRLAGGQQEHCDQKDAEDCHNVLAIHNRSLLLEENVIENLDKDRSHLLQLVG